MNDTGLVSTELDLTSLGVLDSFSDVRGHGANLRVRHQATRAEDLAEAADNAHRVRGGDHNVEVHEASLHLVGEVVETDDVSTGSLRFFTS